MRQTTEHRPYVGLAAVLSHHGQSSAFRSTSHRPGFTLIEVMIALVIIGLAGLGLATFSMQSYRTVQDLTIRATAENLAEVTLEELSYTPGSILYNMTHPSGIDVYSINFPENGYIQHDLGKDPGQEALNAAAACIPPVSGEKTFNTVDGTYHVLCNGQFLLGTYMHFFDGTTTLGVTPGIVGSISSSGAIVNSTGFDLFKSSPWYPSVVTVGNASANDYDTVYSPSQLGFLSSQYTPGYTVYKYELGSGIYLEPFDSGRSGSPVWSEAGLLVFASTAPHLYREVTITDTTPTTDPPTPASARMYKISVRVIWTFGGVRQVVEVAGGKADLR